jgi:hypothetical protein
MSTYGIKETKELLKFVLVTVEESHVGLKNGAGVDDLPRLFTIAKEAPAAFSGIGDIPNEIMDLQDNEYKELCDFIKEDFDIPEDDVEAVVEHGFVCIVTLVKLYNMIGDLRKKNEVVADADA